MYLVRRIFAVSLAALVASPSFAATVLPAETIVVVTPPEEISSRDVKVGDAVSFRVMNDVTQSGVVVIPRGSNVKGEVTWRTGKGIVGKSAKFEVTFGSVNVAGHDWKLRGKIKQEGKGNTMAALLGSSIITGHSAIMVPGQQITVFTAEDITVQ